MNPGWFPDWSGCVAAVIASGPSAKKAKFEALRGRVKVLAVKDNVELCPFADVVYGCDAAWWRLKLGLPKFTGLKVCWAGDNEHMPADFPGLQRIKIDAAQQHNRKPDRPAFDEPGLVGCGGNSGFQAVNLAAQFGAKRILLIGFDLHDRAGVHWFGRNNGQGLTNPDEQNFRRWREAFAGSAPVYAVHGFDVVNASSQSDMKGFRGASIERALAEWGV